MKILDILYGQILRIGRGSFFAVVLCLITSPLFAQNLMGPSGYRGLLTRFQIGGGYGELTEPANEATVAPFPKRIYKGPGAYIAVQLGWGLKENYAVYLGLSHFYTLSLKGEEIQPVVASTVAKTKHIYYISTFSLGFTMYHILSAFHISPEVHFLSYGARKAEQESIITGNVTQTTKYRVLYTNRIGAGLTIGKDTWLNTTFGFGFFLGAHYDSFLRERSELVIKFDPATNTRQNLREELPRESVNQFLVVAGINLIFN